MKVKIIKFSVIAMMMALGSFSCTHQIEDVLEVRKEHIMLKSGSGGDIEFSDNQNILS